MDKLFLGVGAMKSGTTWLYRQLEQHPRIHFSPEKELHFLAWRAGHRNNLGLRYRLSRLAAARGRAKARDGGLRGAELRWYLDYLLTPRTWDWYQRRFGSVPGGCYPADFSNLTALLREPDWSRLAASVSDLRVLYVLRDPLDRIWSHLRAHYSSETARQTLARMSRYQPDGRLAEHDLVLHSRYGENLGRMLSVLPRERVRVVFYDQIEREPTRLLREIEQFLDIPSHDYLQEKLGRRINASDSLTRPEWVREHFLPLLADDLEALAGHGIEVPGTWCR